MRHVVLSGAVRTPIGKFGGGLASLSAADLGVAAAREALKRSGVKPEAVDQTIFGCARQAGGGPNVARQVSIRAGVPKEVPAFTVNMACGSGLKAIDLGFRAIRDGDADVVLVGGTESMSRVPYLLTGARFGYRMGDQLSVDAMYQDGFLCPLAEELMGDTAENLAELHSVTREEQDAFALESQKRAAEAAQAGRFEAEIVPVEVASRKGTERVSTDEHPRPETSLLSLAKLPSVFKAGKGSVSAGNSSGITDGAAALVLVAEERAAALGIEPQARILGVEAAGVDPKIMGIGVVPAVRKLLSRLSRRLEDFELLEVNEAFAAQVLACDRELHFDRSRLNVNGGAIALGHPIGATGARIVVSLVHELARRKNRLGLATLCISGGMGLAAGFESVRV